MMTKPGNAQFDLQRSSVERIELIAVAHLSVSFTWPRLLYDIWMSCRTWDGAIESDFGACMTYSGFHLAENGAAPRLDPGFV
jgi:hypothetical protein